MNSYSNDIKMAAYSHPNFDLYNAKDISNYYGQDYQSVLNDIKELRKTLNLLF